MDEGSSEGDDDDEEEGDELVIRTKKKPASRPKEPLARGFAVVSSPVEPKEEQTQPTTPATRMETLVPPTETPRNPSPVPSEAGTLIATPTKSYTAPPPSRHLRTRNSHTSLQSLTAGSLRSFLAGPHHPLSSPSGGKPARRREGTAPPVVSGEIARGAWAVPGTNSVEGLPASPTRNEGRPNAATQSLRKASFTGSISQQEIAGLPRDPQGTGMGRMSAHSVAQRAALLPTMSSRPSSAASSDAATRHQQERESVNLVSRFVTLPTAEASHGVFPDSPFAGAHASLVRTLMEEGARLLPIDPTANPLRRTDTSRAATPKLRPSAQGTVPYGAAPAPVGQEWVLGLTPFEMSVQRCLAQRKGAVRLATGRSLGPLGA